MEWNVWTHIYPSILSTFLHREKMEPFGNMCLYLWVYYVHTFDSFSSPFSPLIMLSICLFPKYTQKTREGRYYWIFFYSQKTYKKKTVQVQVQKYKRKISNFFILPKKLPFPFLLAFLQENKGKPKQKKSCTRNTTTTTFTITTYIFLILPPRIMRRKKLRQYLPCFLFLALLVVVVVVAWMEE